MPGGEAHSAGELEKLMKNILLLICAAGLSACFICNKSVAPEHPNSDGAYHEPGAPQEVVVKRVTMSEAANYNFNDSKVATDNIESVLNELSRHPGATLRIEGYTDNLGQEEYNKKLSEKRAKEAEKIVKKKYKYTGHIEVVGLGSENPIADNATEEGRARNRRVDFVIVK